MSRRAWIALGSNLGDSHALLDVALNAIAELPQTQLQAVSSRYRTAPIGGPEQGDFVNAVCRISTDLAPLDLLHALQQIEHKAGRERHQHWGPRTLDLDLIAIDGVAQTEAALTLPHPRAHQRAFVLQPLAELDADLPLAGRPVSAWLDSVADQTIERLPG